MIPFEHKPFVTKLRNFIGDRAELNKLLEDEEADDKFLYQCILDALDSANYEFGPATTVYTVTTYPSWTILRDGATINFLIGKGILSARNTLTYNDASNITVQDTDVWGRYLQFYRELYARFVRAASAITIRNNIDSCYGGVESEFSL